MNSNISEICFCVSGLSQASDAGEVRQALLKSIGITDARVDYPSGNVRIEFSDGETSIAKLMDVVKGAGFGVIKESQRLSIEGMYCAACASAVEKTMLRLPGVLSASVNLTQLTADVTYVAGAINLDRIAEAITAVGYPAKPIGEFDDSGTPVAEHRKEYLKNLRTFGVAAIGGAIVMVLAMLPVLPPNPSHYVQMVITALTLAFAGRQFFIGAWKSALHRRADMNSLIAIGTGTAFLFSLYSTVFPQHLHDSDGHSMVYYETAVMIIAFILLGRALEGRAKSRASNAVSGLLSLTPKTVRIEQENGIKDIPIAQLQSGNVIRVHAGERLPADGKIIDGQSAVDESMLTGEAIPVMKKSGDTVYGGTLNGSGTMRIIVTKTGSESILGQIVRLVEQAQGTKAPIQHLADRVAAVFVPIVVVIALLTLIIWLFVVPKGQISFAVTAFVSVLIIACPCAMGLATPTAILVGSGTAARRGVVFKGGDSLERAARVNVLAFDKTGTLTVGRPVVTEIIASDGVSEDEVLKLAGSVEIGSEHPVGRAIHSAAQERMLSLLPITGFEALTGRGVKAQADGRTIFVGTNEWISEQTGSLLESDLLDKLTADGKMIAVVAVLGQGVKGAIAVADQIRQTAASTVAQLRLMGIHTIMLTGDSEISATRIAGEAGIDEFDAGLLPVGKVDRLQEVRSRMPSAVIGMVGDGINDAPALATADIGIAIGSGSDIAVEASDVTLFGSDLAGVVFALKTARKTLKIIKQNLFWAFFYNILGIPLAAGLLYPLTGHMLSPMVAAAAMALSSVSVVGNSLRLGIGVDK